MSKSSSTSVLDHVRIASPCPASWEAMIGDNRSRFCKLCRLNVYNLSAMDRTEAEALIESHEGRLCIQYYARPDGTIITADCPIGVTARRYRLCKTMRRLAALIALTVGACFWLASGVKASRLRNVQPIAKLCNLLEPTPAVARPPGIAVTPRAIRGRAGRPIRPAPTSSATMVGDLRK